MTKSPTRLLAVAVVAVAGILLFHLFHAPKTQTLDAQSTNIILFDSRDAQGDRDVYRVDANGDNLDRLTITSGDPGDSFGPDWSPSKRRIVFCSNRRDGFYDIYVMNADGSDVERLTRTATEQRNSIQPKWSPDGKQIGFISTRGPSRSWREWDEYEIYLMDADGTNVRRLTDNDVFDSPPAWSPDGRTLAFMSIRSGRREIYLMDPDGSNVRRLTHDDRAAAHPDWSPDGKRIAFMSTRDATEERRNEDGAWEVYLMDMDGENVVRLTNNADTFDGHPNWSPDGTQIVFSSTRNGRYNIYVMRTDGSSIRRVTVHDQDDLHPIW